MRLEVNPEFAAAFAALGLDTPAGCLDRPGEVVSGHPDRHVLRVELPGFPHAFYLKRQHTVTRRERWRNWRAGFGWVSRCEREAAILKQLDSAGLSVPRWAAFGEDDCGRAFLLVAEVSASVDLRTTLSERELSRKARLRLASRLGQLIARLHVAGFTTPDLTAKHILVGLETGELTAIDWQSARRMRWVSPADRLRTLAALHASLADDLATPRERLRVLRAALRMGRESGIVRGSFSEIARGVAAEAHRHRSRRSIRDQRQSIVRDQRLVWLAGEAVCAIPEAAALWPSPAVAAPYYDSGPGAGTIRLADDRDAWLIRGQSFDPWGRLAAHVRGRPWRSPGATLGRVLFHLDRYGIPAPRLLAFGQRMTGRASAEWFALHTPPADRIEEVTDTTAGQLGRIVRQLHDAGCRPAGRPLTAFGVDESGIAVRDAAAIQLARRMTRRDRADDLRSLIGALPPICREAAERGYRGEVPDTRRLTPASACA